MTDELEKLRLQSHDGVTTFDFDGKDVPCIIVEEKKYDELLSKVAGKPSSINTDLNILQDGLGHVFVEVILTFSDVKVTEKFLIDANKHLEFFQSLAVTSILALSSPKSHYGRDNVFMIQLPRTEKVESALTIIEKGLQNNSR